MPVLCMCVFNIISCQMNASLMKVIYKMLLAGANFGDKNPFFRIWLYYVVEQLILKYEVETIKFEILVTPYFTLHIKQWNKAIFPHFQTKFSKLQHQCVSRSQKDLLTGKKILTIISKTNSKILDFFPKWVGGHLEWRFFLWWYPLRV